MAIDKAVDSAVLEAGLTAIANAIREKGGTSETLAFPDSMAEAIAAIEAGGGNVISGEITLLGGDSNTLDLTPYGISRDNIPWARFLFEKPGISTKDDSHTMNRVLVVANIVVDSKVGYAKQSSSCVSLYTQAGSNSLKVDKTSVAGFWSSLGSASTSYSLFTGQITDSAASLYFYCPDSPASNAYGLIPGRTYLWGVIL